MADLIEQKIENGLRNAKNAGEDEGMPDGLTPEQPDDEIKFTGALEELFEKINNALDPKNAKGPFAVFMQTAQRSINKLFGESQNDDESTDDFKEKITSTLLGDKTGPKINPQPPELLKLGSRDSMGYLLLYWKLDAFHKDFVKSKGIKEGGDGGEKDPGKGLAKFFKSFLSGASGLAAMAGALMLFSGALAIFQLVQWGSAIAGMMFFAGFITGMYYLAKFISDKKMDKDLIQFGKTALILSAALGVFGISLFILTAMTIGSTVQSPIGPIKVNFIAALAGLAFFGLFIWWVAFLTNKFNTQQKNLKDFAITSILLAGALGVFSISLWITSALWKGDPIFGKAIDPEAAFKGLGAYALFLVVMLGLSWGVNSNAGTFVEFGKTSLILSISLLAFSVALYITSFIYSGQPIGPLPKINVMGAILGVGSFAVFLAVMVGISILAEKNQAKIKQLGIVSLILSGSLLLFGIALWVAGSMPNSVLEKAFISLVAFAGILFIASKVGKAAQDSIVGLLAFGIASVLLSVSLILFGVALNELGKAAPFIPTAIVSMALIITFMGGAVALGMFIKVIGPPLLIGLVGLMAAMVLLIPVGALANKVFGYFDDTMAKNALAGATAMGSLAIMVMSVVVAGMYSIPMIMAATMLGFGFSALQKVAVKLNNIAPTLAGLPDLTQPIANIKSIGSLFQSLAQSTQWVNDALLGLTNMIPALISLKLSMGILSALNLLKFPDLNPMALSIANLSPIFGAIGNLEPPPLFKFVATAVALNQFKLLLAPLNDIQPFVASLAGISTLDMIQSIENLGHIKILAQKLQDIDLDSGKGIKALQKTFDAIKFKNIDLLDSKLQSITKSLEKISERKQDVQALFNSQSVDGGTFAYTQRSTVVSANQPDGQSSDSILNSIYELLVQWYNNMPVQTNVVPAMAMAGGSPGNALSPQDLKRAASGSGGSWFKSLFKG